MAISKEDILTTGIEIFSEKGYQDTSVQDIAERCGMSKASFYSFFPSKEDIFIAVFMELQDHFKSNIAMLSNIQLEPRVQFQHACSLLIELFSQNGQILRSSSTPEPPIINARKAEFGGWILRMFKSMIEEIYGPEFAAYAWDMTILQRGIQREFSNLLANGNLGGYTVNQAAAYICDVLDCLAEGMASRKLDPFITPSVAETYLDISLGQNVDLLHYVENFEKNVRSALANIKHKQRSEEILQMVQFFKTEIGSAQPRWYLLHAILDSLRNEKELRGITKQLQQLLAAVSPESEEK